jgi:hypothetical protein
MTSSSCCAGHGGSGNRVFFFNVTRGNKLDIYAAASLSRPFGAQPVRGVDAELGLRAYMHEIRGMELGR